MEHPPKIGRSTPKPRHSMGYVDLGTLERPISKTIEKFSDCLSY